MKKLIISALLILLVLIMTGCKNQQDPDQTVVRIYYIDTTTSELVSENYSPTETQKELLVGELLEALKQEPEKVIYKSALPEAVSILEYNFNENGNLSINFDAAYSELTGIPEVLCRAAIIKTLSQIAGVEYIDFTVKGQPLKDSNGKVVISMTDDFFIKSIGDETNYKASLYFTDEQGELLSEYVSNIYYAGTSSLEELVINQLINGPTEIGLYHTIPEGTTLLNVQTKEGVCYVDFNEKFLENTSKIKDEVVIYSVVNTLVELPNISKVQFKINGQLQKTYRENIPFDGLFERNLDLIKGSK